MQNVSNASSDLLEARSFRPDIPLVFLHFPKTSGQALARGLIDAIQPRRLLYPVFDRVLFGDFSAFETLQPQIREQIYGWDRPLPQDFDFLSGHVSWSGVAEHEVARQFFSIVREPVSRLFSHWTFWRGLSGEEVSEWGEWSTRLAIAQYHLLDFLSTPDVACAVDNLYVRMLVWPHPLLPDDSFIDKASDEVLVDLALARIRGFDFVDVYENPHLEWNVQGWLRRTLSYSLVNATRPVPCSFHLALHRELTPEVFELLEARTRLDRQVWTAIARERMPESNLDAIREQTIMRNLTRFALLLSGTSINVG